MKMKFIVGTVVTSVLLVCGTITPEVEITAHEGETNVAQAKPGKHTHEWTQYHSKKDDSTGEEPEVTAPAVTDVSEPDVSEPGLTEQKPRIEYLTYKNCSYKFDNFGELFESENMIEGYVDSNICGVYRRSFSNADRSLNFTNYTCDDEKYIGRLDIITSDCELSNGIRIGMPEEEVVEKLGVDFVPRGEYVYEDDDVIINFYFGAPSDGLEAIMINLKSADGIKKAYKENYEWGDKRRYHYD